MNMTIQNIRFNFYFTKKTHGKKTHKLSIPQMLESKIAF